MRRRCFSPRWLAASLLGLLLAGSATPAAERYAILVGINQYEHPKLRELPLKYAVNDAVELAGVLKAAGYRVTLMTDESKKTDRKLAPTKANIEAALRAALKDCKRGDTVLLALAGHGVQFGGKDAFFCPIDARPFEDETATLVSLTQIYNELDKSFAGAKVLFVDACRNDPTPGRGRGVDGDNSPPPPKGVAALFSCSAGQRAFEHDQLKHGVFFHFVLEGLKNEAIDAQGEVTFEGLSLFVRRSVPRKVKELFPDQKPDQLPNLKADLVGTPPVLVSGVKRRTAPLATLLDWWTRDAYKADAEKVGLDRTQGVLVQWALTEAGPQSPALKTGDVIVSVNGEPVPNERQFDVLMRGMTTPSVCKFGVWRGGQSQAIEMQRPAVEELITGLYARELAIAEKGDPWGAFVAGFRLSNGSGVKQDPQAAIAWYRKAADKGVADATVALGMIYYRGQSVPANREEGMAWFRKAADTGDPPAQSALGGLHRYGDPKDRNEAKAFEWYQKAAEQDHREAQAEVGYSYEFAAGVEQSGVQAARWYRRSAEADNPRGAARLGGAYLYGLGVAKDFKAAMPLLRRTAEQDDAIGLLYLGRAYLSGWGVERDYGKAVHYFRKSADQGQPAAQLELGQAYRDGLIEQDYAESIRWFRKAADAGNDTAQNALGFAYEKGQGVGRDFSQAVGWYGKAAAAGSAVAMGNLGNVYYDGRDGIPQSYAEAIKWYYAGASKGNTHSQFMMGIMSHKAQGCTRDFGVALKWFRLAADQGHANAQDWVGAMYRDGEGVQRDNVEAARWFRKAAAQGHESAKRNLAALERGTKK